MIANWRAKRSAQPSTGDRTIRKQASASAATSSASRLDGRTLESFVIDEGMKRLEALLRASARELGNQIADPAVDAVREKIRVLSARERKALLEDLDAWKLAVHRRRSVRNRRRRREGL